MWESSSWCPTQCSCQFVEHGPSNLATTSSHVGADSKIRFMMLYLGCFNFLEIFSLTSHRTQCWHVALAVAEEFSASLQGMGRPSNRTWNHNQTRKITQSGSHKVAKRSSSGPAARNSSLKWAPSSSKTSIRRSLSSQQSDELLLSHSIRRRASTARKFVHDSNSWWHVQPNLRRATRAGNEVSWVWLIQLRLSA